MILVVYGSFNCPYSFLASLRADRLRAAGAAKIEWSETERAVVPMMVLADGTLSRGLGALARLAELAAATGAGIADHP